MLSKNNGDHVTKNFINQNILTIVNSFMNNHGEVKINDK
jgi:hypothetical protein